MLVLSRKAQQDIIIGDNVRITVLQIKGNTVRLGIEAPREVRVVRGELPAHNSASNRETSDAVAEFSLEFEISDVPERAAPMRVIGQSTSASHGNAVRPEKPGVSAFKVIRDETDMKSVESRKELALENRVHEILSRMSKTPR